MVPYHLWPWIFEITFDNHHPFHTLLLEPCSTRPNSAAPSTHNYLACSTHSDSGSHLTIIIAPQMFVGCLPSYFHSRYFDLWMDSEAGTYFCLSSLKAIALLSWSQGFIFSKKHPLFDLGLKTGFVSVFLDELVKNHQH